MSPFAAASDGLRTSSPAASRLRDLLGVGAQADDDGDARVLEVLGVGVALGAEADDRDGLAVEVREVRVVVVEHGAAW